MAQIKLNIQTTFSDTGLVGKVLKRKKTQNMEREAIKMSLAIVHGAETIAAEGGSLKEVKAIIEESRSQFETFQSIALAMVENRNIVATNEKLSVVRSESINRDISSTKTTLDLDDEEF